jgi:hypothetical protein
VAGFIFFKGDNGLSIDGVAFNAIAEISRPYFNENDNKYIEEIYYPKDKGGMDMISLAEQDTEGFNAYYKGTRNAYEECMRESKCGELGSQYFDMVMEAWKELINLLECDDRFRRI